MDIIVQQIVVNYGDGRHLSSIGIAATPGTLVMSESGIHSLSEHTANIWNSVATLDCMLYRHPRHGSNFGQ